MPASDVVRRLSDEVARDPTSTAWLPLAELLAREGDRDAALRAARNGAARHPGSLAAHRLLGELAAGAGAWDEAAAAYERAAGLAPQGVERATALQGAAHARVRAGRIEEAAALLTEAARAGGDASAIAAARERLAALCTAAVLDADAGSVLQDDDLAALRVRADGAVLAVHSRARMPDGSDAVVGAEVAGLAEEATRAMRHLRLGPWERIVVEADAAHVALAPAAGGVVVAATPAAAPPGRLERLLRRALGALAGPAEGA